MNQWKSMGWTIAAPLVAAGLTVTGCATTSPGAAAPAVASAPAGEAPAKASAPATESPVVAPAAGGADTDDQAAEEVREHHRHHHHSGISMFVALSLDSLGLPPEKKTQVEKLQAELEEKTAPARAADRALLSLIAQGVAVGSIDTKQVDAALAQVATAAAGVHAATVNALNQLHSVLSPAERAALADKVEAHWEVWRNVNHEEKLGSREKGSRLATLAEALALTPDQVSRIEQNLTASAPPPQVDVAVVQAHVEAFAKAFTSEHFDAASLSTADAANLQIARSGAARTARFYEAVAPVLTADQRTKLAAHLQDHLNNVPPGQK